MQALRRLQLDQAVIDYVLELDASWTQSDVSWYMDTNIERQIWRATRGLILGRRNSWACPCGRELVDDSAFGGHFPWYTKGGHRFAPEEVRNQWILWYNNGQTVSWQLRQAFAASPLISEAWTR